MAEYVTSVTQKGQVTIPAPLRRVLGVKPRDKIAFQLVDGDVRIRPIESAILASYGAVKPLKPLKPPKPPLDYRQLRRETEEEIADEVTGER
ncbi:MAG: hypothetical protein BZY88_00430 [SAR202 cluster bacterium Io17-Chloro-G9]|nr:MAG: hypothetical protein BZY88_00430 [SAR202 cluster bacterium Io17-Chloro-G9]